MFRTKHASRTVFGTKQGQALHHDQINTQGITLDFHRSVLRQPGHGLRAEIQTSFDQGLFLSHLTVPDLDIFQQRLLVCFSRSDAFLFIKAKLAQLRDGATGQEILIPTRDEVIDQNRRIVPVKRRVGRLSLHG